MLTSQAARMWHRPQWGKVSALVLCCAIGLLPLACGDGHQNDQQAATLDSPLSEFSHSTLVRLNTAALARAVQAGKEIQLPFARPGGGTVNRKVQLTLRNLRSPDLTEFVLKDGDAGTGSTRPLPPPATYQGKVRNGGVAVFTINANIVEGSILEAPDGWSFIEPLEPLLRIRNVPQETRDRLLKKFNHVVYNTRDLVRTATFNEDQGAAPTKVGSPQPPSPLVMSVVGDGDVGLLRAYPLDSVMPFWLKQETLFNAIDWLYNCVEPDSNADNAYADCRNDFDGGGNGFQARVRIDRLEVWTSGGPQGDLRSEVLFQSVTMTHQSSPVCCGPPHTAGRANLVHFFSGRGFLNGAGEAFGIGGINEYGAPCDDTTSVLGKCHHAVSQLVPNPPDVTAYTFDGNAFEQWALVAHEIGHNANAGDCGSTQECKVSWLFDQQIGNSVMKAPSAGFDHETFYLYEENVTQNMMGPLLAEQLGSAPGSP